MTRKTQSRLLLVLLLCLMQGCSSVTMRPYGGEKNMRKPDYAVSKTFWFWGLKGEHEVNVTQVCEGRRVEQMQTVMTISDFARGIFTLFIYAPRTAKVWCEPASAGASAGVKIAEPQA